MSEWSETNKVVSLPVAKPIWEQVWLVSPLVVVGTREENGRYDFAPKHMAMPMGWDNYYGFICTPRHSTYHNVKRTGEFTVSFPRPTQVITASLTAAPRCNDDSKPTLDKLPTIAAETVDGFFLKDAYLFLECAFDQVVDGFGENSLIVGKVIAAHVAQDSLRTSEQNDVDLLEAAPLLAYLSWGRYARIDKSYPFPFLSGFQR